MNARLIGILPGVLLSVAMSSYAGVGREDLSDDAKAGLQHMREEEKLAHDLYSAFGDLYNLRIFENIPMAEANHMAAIATLLDAFDLDDPANPEAGVFQNEELQAAYDQLLSDGKVSLVAALESGAYVEELDIRDLERLLDETKDESIKVVYSNLLRGSRNHLRAFTRVLANNGENYEPKLLSQDHFEEIIEGDMERGGQGQGAAVVTDAGETTRSERIEAERADLNPLFFIF